MSNTMEATCRNCNTPSMVPIFCDGCFDEYRQGTQAIQLQAKAERDARVAAYAGQPTMTPLEWVGYLYMYNFDVLKSEKHSSESARLYREFGSSLPFCAIIGDHQELNHALTVAQIDCDPEEYDC